MKASPKYDAAVFDLDGTLLDTLQDIADSVNAALAAEGLAGHPADSYRLMVGNGMDVLVERAVAGASRAMRRSTGAGSGPVSNTPAGTTRQPVRTTVSRSFSTRSPRAA